MTQDEVRTLFGMSQAGYSKLESGETDNTLSRVAQAAEITGLSPAQLLAPQGRGEAVADPSQIPLPLALQRVIDAGYAVSREPFQGPVPET